MSGIRTGTVTSADGTVIVFDRSGAGPAVVLVQGALNDRADPVMSGLAAGLSRWFTVFSYDRRGRGDSGDTQPYAVEREIEDLAAVIAAAGGSAAVFGGSSGAGLALRAAVREPGHHPAGAVGTAVPRRRQRAPAARRLRRSNSTAWSRRAGGPTRWSFSWSGPPRPARRTSRGCAAMPSWPAMEAAARSLAYEARVMGPGNALPAQPAGRHHPARPGAQRRRQPGLDEARGTGGRGRHTRSQCTGCSRASALRGARGHRPRAAGVPRQVLTGAVRRGAARQAAAAR